MVLLSYDRAARRIAFRHFSILVAPSGVSKAVKALVGRRALPDMGELKDVSEFLTRSGYGSVRAPASAAPAARRSARTACRRGVQRGRLLRDTVRRASVGGGCFG